MITSMILKNGLKTKFKLLSNMTHRSSIQIKHLQLAYKEHTNYTTIIQVDKIFTRLAMIMKRLKFLQEAVLVYPNLIIIPQLRSYRKILKNHLQVLRSTIIHQMEITMIIVILINKINRSFML